MSVSGGCILAARGEVISVMVKLDGVHCVCTIGALECPCREGHERGQQRKQDGGSQGKSLH